MISCFEDSTLEPKKSSEDNSSHTLINRGDDKDPSLGFYLGYEVAKELKISDDNIDLLLLVGHDGLTYLDGYFKDVKDVAFSVVM